MFLFVGLLLLCEIIVGFECEKFVEKFGVSVVVVGCTAKRKMYEYVIFFVVVLIL